MQIRTRLTIQFVVLVSVIILVGFAALFFLRKIQLEEQFYDRLGQKALTAAELLVGVEEVDPEMLRKIEESDREVLFKQNTLLYNFRNDVIYRGNDTIDFQLTPVELNNIRRLRRMELQKGEFQVVGLVYTTRYEQVLSVVGAVNQADEISMRTLLGVMFWAYLASVGLVALLGWFFAGRALRPISNVMNEVEGILPQSLDRRVQVQNESDEIGRLTRTFNALLDRLEQAFRLQNMFISNVSHEIRNPLTKLTAQLEVSLLRERSGEEYRQTMRSVLADVREMSQLSNTLLELAKVSDKAQPFLTSEVRIDEILWEARDLLRSTNPEYRILVHFPDDLEDEALLTLNGNAYLLKVMSGNLMQNGCKFSDDHTVEVTMKVFAATTELCFANAARLDETDTSLLFEPFYRSQKTADVAGYGIGLSLVDRIVKLHGGSIDLAQGPNRVAFTVTLPRHGLGSERMGE